MRVTRAKITEGAYAILVDGKPTGMEVHKWPAPKYRHPQMWEVSSSANADDFLFEADGLLSAIKVIQSILDSVR